MSRLDFIYLIILFLFCVSNEGRRWTEEAAVEEVSQVRVEAETGFYGVGGYPAEATSGGSGHGRRR